MALSLLEAFKGETDVFRRGVIGTFIEDSRLFQVLPFRDIPGGHDGVLREAVLPAAATRAVNAAYTPSEGRTEEVVESLKIYGGDIGIDPFIVRTAPDKVPIQTAMKIKAISNLALTDFFKGDTSAAAGTNGVNGLQTRLSGYNIVDAGTTNGGDALPLTVLDEAILRCNNPQFILMNRKMQIRFSQAARTTAVSGYLTYARDDFGRQIMRYGDLEIIRITDNANNDDILPFTEVGVGGSTATAVSVYVIGTGDDGVYGIQNGGIQVRNIGEDNTTPREDTRVEWYWNYQIEHPRSAIRVRGIKDLAIVT